MVNTGGRVFIQILALSLPRSIIRQRLLVGALFRLHSQVQVGLRATLLLPFLIVDLGELMVKFRREFSPRHFRVECGVFANGAPAARADFAPFRYVTYRGASVNLNVYPIGSVRPFLFERLNP